MLTGEVVAFDDDRGYGSLRSDSGEAFFFHCTAVADGSRAIAEGARVHFVIVPGHRGRWEGADLTPVGGA